MIDKKLFYNWQCGRISVLSVPHLEWLCIIAIIVFGAYFRARGISSELPFVYNPDEPVFIDRAFRLLENGTFDPGWYGHPGQFTIYLLSLSFVLLFVVSLYAGIVGGFGQFIHWFNYDPSVFYIFGRVISALFSIGCLALVAIITRRVAVYSITVMLSLLLVAINPLLVDFSFLVRSDNQMTFFSLLTCFFSMKIAERGKRLDYVFAGLALGVAVSCKYPAVLFAVSIVAAHLLISNGRFWARWNDLLLSGVASLAAIFVTGPYLFLNAEGMLRDVRAENSGHHLSAGAHGRLESLAWYFEHVFVPGAGYLGAALFILGACVGIWRLDKGRIVLTIAALAFFGLIVNLQLHWTRWLIPFVPLYLMIIALGIEDIVRWGGRVRTSLIGGVLSIIVLTNPALSIAKTLAQRQTHLATQAFVWILKNVPKDSKILLERYTAQLPKNEFNLWQVTDAGRLVQLNSDRKFITPKGHVGALKDFEEIELQGIEFVVLGSDYNRRMKEAARYPEEIMRYEKLLQKYPVVFTVAARTGTVAMPELKDSLTILRVE